MMKTATVYKRKGRYLVHASSLTTTGLWILSAPCLAVPSTSEDGSLGEAVLAALEGSRAGVPHPHPSTNVFEPMLTLAGVKTWGTFAKSASSVQVEMEGATVTVVPMKNLGPAEGFEEDSAHKVVLTPGSADASEPVAPDELGKAVRALLERA